jgi:hypothetical protein
MDIKITHIPFIPKIRTESVFYELASEIEKVARKFNKNPQDFSAKIEILPDPRGKQFGHFGLSEVTYLKGNLNKKQNGYKNN